MGKERIGPRKASEIYVDLSSYFRWGRLFSVGKERIGPRKVCEIYVNLSSYFGGEGIKLGMPKLPFWASYLTLHETTSIKRPISISMGTKHLKKRFLEIM